ncbi:MAG: Fur family transcriptional regulator [Pseudopedobacter saltans]|uniref:Fur family transcriptional regulator n=1 Tax=Pseudopedobacter saltans TaxID=151895 RepID=A0A2W5FA97_9SPHI|nr:MAG: Fur family transcriptional regulator [Pseudopedobacter saltans]
MEDIQKVLKASKLSVTETRTAILKLFLQSTGALSHAAIEKATRAQFDRVTIYRTLQSFLEKGIIHTIPTDDNSIQYALCKGECSEGHHHDDHVHFICKDCGTTYCLDHVEIPKITLPKGFKGEDFEVVVKGVCEECND